MAQELLDGYHEDDDIFCCLRGLKGVDMGGQDCFVRYG